VTVGETYIIGIASATAVHLAALPTPTEIQFSGSTIQVWSDSHKIYLDVENKYVRLTTELIPP
jgi:hypothetical protein